MTKSNAIALFVLAVTLAICAPKAGAANAGGFYSGKTVAIAASAGPGSAIDGYTRLLARYLQKYIPGVSAVVVKNEPGAGGLRVAQETYAVADKDGTNIGEIRASVMLDAVLGLHGAQIDPNKFEWIGNMASDTDLCSFWYTAGVHSFADLTKKQVIVGSSGEGAQNYAFPNAFNHILHTKMKIIVGYKGVPDRILAMERGELQGNCGMSSSSIISHYSQLIASGKLVPIMQSGLQPNPALPNVPLTQSFATTDQQRGILMTIFSQMQLQREYAVPPGTPQDRVEILRKAFMQALNDPGLRAEAKKMKLGIAPMSGEEVAKAIAKMSNIPVELKAEVRAAIGG